jgi:hypothetical protein
MGILETEIMELRKLITDVKEKQVDIETARTVIGIYNQVSKRVSHIIQVASISAKYGDRDKTWNKILNKNLLSSGAIECKEVGEEVVKCADQGGKLITREECLDHSGLERNIDRCQNCEQFSITRKTFP